MLEYWKFFEAETNEFNVKQTSEEIGIFAVRAGILRNHLNNNLPRNAIYTYIIRYTYTHSTHKRAQERTEMSIYKITGIFSNTC